MDKFCEEKGFIGWYETSAKENINIDEAANFLVQKVSVITIVFLLQCYYYYQLLLVYQLSYNSKSVIEIMSHVMMKTKH